MSLLTSSQTRSTESHERRRRKQMVTKKATKPSLRMTSMLLGKFLTSLERYTTRGKTRTMRSN
jgi:hypothetical protein